VPLGDITSWTFPLVLHPPGLGKIRRVGRGASSVTLVVQKRWIDNTGRRV